MSESAAPKLELSLFHLEQGLVDLIAYRAERVAQVDGPLVEGELEAIDAEIKRYEIATPQKVSGVAAIFRSWRAHRETAKAEIKRLQGIVAAIDAMDERLKEYVGDVLARLPEPKKGCRKLVGADGSSLTLKGNGGLAPLQIDDESLVPDEYKRVTVTMRLDVWNLLGAYSARDIYDFDKEVKEIIEVDTAGVRKALEERCEQCGGDSALLVDPCNACGGTGKRGVPGARLLPRGQHVECH